MSISDWKKRWLYDSKVEIPKTTKWRRRCENINHGISDDIRLGDVWGDLSSETIELGNNTSPFKRQRSLRDCLSNLPISTSSSIIKPCERKLYGNFCMQTENAEDLEVCLNNGRPLVDSSNIGYHVSRSQTDMQDCDGIDESSQTGDERHLESSHQITTAEALINPNVWQNMSCDNEFDENDFQPSPGSEVNGLPLSTGGTLIDSLTAWDDIPDMDSFKETSTSNQNETLEDVPPLYKDSMISVSESSLLIMAFAVRHKLSGVALEDLLELIHVHCPKPNKCITEIREFQLFFQALKHPILKHYYCPNTVCKVYVGSSEPENGTKCAVCATTLCRSAYFIEIPVVEQLKTILSRPEMIDKLEYRFRRVKMDSEAIEDVYDGKLYKKYSSPGGFLSDPHNISFLGNTDGVALIKSTSYGVWPVYLIVNEIPPSERQSISNVQCSPAFALVRSCR